MRIESGKGLFVSDSSGKRFVDVNSGQFCAVLGHRDRRFVKTLRRAAGNVIHTDTTTLAPTVIQTIQDLVKTAPEMGAGGAVLLSTGAEANEMALRYAKFFTSRDGVISFDRGYHGQTHGTAAYSMARSRIRPPIPGSFSVPVPIGAPWRDPRSSLTESIEGLTQVVEANSESIGAMIFEPVVSGGGMLFPPAEFFVAARALCDIHDIKLIFDECQTGVGRLGAWWGFQTLGVVPDIVVSSKALGNGFPVAAAIFSEDLMSSESVYAMRHFSSHQNDPMAAAVVRHVISRVTPSLLERVAEVGARFLSELLGLAKDFPEYIHNPRGKGLMVGFDLVPNPFAETLVSPPQLVKAAERSGLLLQDANFGRTIRLLPSYSMSPRDLGTVMSLLRRSFELLRKWE